MVSWYWFFLFASHWFATEGEVDKTTEVSLAMTYSRQVQGQVFKEERNNDYGVYTENNVGVAEVVDQNTNYEQSESQAPGPVYDYENWEDDYDKMYDKMD